MQNHQSGAWNSETRSLIDMKQQQAKKQHRNIKTKEIASN